MEGKVLLQKKGSEDVLGETRRVSIKRKRPDQNGNRNTTGNRSSQPKHRFGSGEKTFGGKGKPKFDKNKGGKKPYGKKQGGKPQVNYSTDKVLALCERIVDKAIIFYNKNNFRKVIFVARGRELSEKPDAVFDCEKYKEHLRKRISNAVKAKKLKYIKRDNVRFYIEQKSFKNKPIIEMVLMSHKPWRKGDTFFNSL